MWMPPLHLLDALLEDWLSPADAARRIAALDGELAGRVKALDTELQARVCANLSAALGCDPALAETSRSLAWADEFLGARADGVEEATRSWLAFRFSQAHPGRRNPWGECTLDVALADAPSLVNSPRDVCRRLERAIADQPEWKPGVATAWVEWMLRRLEMNSARAGVSVKGVESFEAGDALLVAAAAWQRWGDPRFLNGLLRQGDRFLRDRDLLRDPAAAAAVLACCVVREAALEGAR